jgi:serine/threonine-protein kinase
MGKVFRARDTRLGRDVAIKVIGGDGPSDADRRQRFQREARAIAALSHPHICSIHDVGSEAGIDYLVLELVPGESLAARLRRGALPVDDALARGIEIARALDCAHRAGIVHRDLKPGNVMLTPAGAKVLDFGLGRITRGETDAPPASAGASTASLTQAGVVLGTLPYMAPEQIEGRVADARTDVFAFCATLYEMLTGKRAFATESAPGLVDAIVRGDTPSLSAVQPNLPPALDQIIRTCLAKDPEARFSSLNDVAIALQWARDASRDTRATASAGGTAGPAALDPLGPEPRDSRSRVSVTVAVAAVGGGALVAALATVLLTRPPPSTPPLPVRFEIVTPSLERRAGIAISPDGRHIAYSDGRGDRSHIVVRDLDQLDGRALYGPASVSQPFFSPDGRSIGFFDYVAGLKRVPTSGGPAITVVPDQLGASWGLALGASWGADNTIVYATAGRTGLLRVAAGGGEPTVLTKPDPASGEGFHGFPFVLPGGRGVLFTIGALDDAGLAQVAVVDPRTGEQKPLLRPGSHAHYVETGHLVYLAGGALHAVEFDLDRLELSGEPVPIVDGVAVASTGMGAYSISLNGTLVFEPAGTPVPRSLVWVDRSGRETEIPAPPHDYIQPRLSPDGTRVAVSVADLRNKIHILDLTSGNLTALTSGPGIDRMPIWTSDGRHIVFQSSRAGAFNLYSQAADGTGTVQRLTSGPDRQSPAWVAPDGTRILGSERSSVTFGDIVWFPLARPLGQPGSSIGPALPDPSPVERLVHTPSVEFAPDVSPNGRYVAYFSNESGSPEICVRPLPGAASGLWRVSTGGGTQPRWAPGGTELFYLDSANVLKALPVDTSKVPFTMGKPAQLFAIPARGDWSTEPDYDAASDGERFIVAKPVTTGDRRADAPRMVVVLNWTEELKAKMPVNR